MKLDSSFKQTLLQASVMHNTVLLISWNTIAEVERAYNPGMAVTVTYSESVIFLILQSKNHDLATPFKQATSHAHKANFDSFIDSNNELGDDDDNGPSTPTKCALSQGSGKPFKSICLQKKDSGSWETRRPASYPLLSSSHSERPVAPILLFLHFLDILQRNKSKSIIDYIRAVAKRRIVILNRGIYNKMWIH